MARLGNYSCSSKEVASKRPCLPHVRWMRLQEDLQQESNRKGRMVEEGLCAEDVESASGKGGHMKEWKWFTDLPYDNPLRDYIRWYPEPGGNAFKFLIIKA